MLMPKLQPFPIKTKKYHLMIKLWKLLVRKRQWQLIEDWQYRLPNQRIIVIPKGFVFDGSTYPWLVWIFFSPTGLLLIPVIIHEFSFKHNYLWGLQDDKVFKFKENNGFLNWCQLVRKIGIERNELMIIDYFIWCISIFLGWINWRLLRRKKTEDIYPQHFTLKQ